MQLIERAINCRRSIYVTKLMRHLRRRERIAGYVVSGTCRHERIHDRKIDGIGIALVEARAQYDRGSDKLPVLVPLVFTRRGAFCVIACKGDGQFEIGIRRITMPLPPARFSGEKFTFPRLIPIEEFGGNVFSDATTIIVRAEVSESVIEWISKW